jgi:hypothetical protein
MMKRILWRLNLMAAIAAVTLSGRATAVSAAEEERGGPADRIERLERRVNEMAQRQEELMRRLAAQPERPAMAPGLGGEGRGAMPMPGVGNMPQPPLPAVSPTPSVPPLPTAPNPMKKIGDLIGFCLFVGFIINILVAVWIFTDIRKRGEGSGIFVALALLAGIPTAIIYAIVCIRDKKT